MHRIVTAAATFATVAALSACNSAGTAHRSTSPAPTLSMTVTSPVSTPATPVRATRSPALHVRVPAVAAAELGRSWRPGCPVGPASLRAVSVTYWGFDRAAHTGTLVVNAAVVSAVVAALRQMYAARYPIRRMVPVAAYGGDDNKSMAADNTSAFNCRAAVANGPKTWSMHAFGEAIDFDAVENPYTLDGRVYPPNGKAYTDRSNVRPGMVVPGSAPVRAFSSIGWGWGGRWSSSPDYQHFSSNGK